MWALAPWDNDEAADWYGDLMGETKLRQAWLKGISEDPSGSPEVVRAAGVLFVMLGRVYVWPIDSFDQDLELAITAMSKVADCAEFQEAPELKSLITTEIEELKSRRRKPDEPKSNAPPAAQTKPWWRFW